MSQTAAPEVSLVLPVHQGEAFIAENVAAVARALDAIEGGYELIVVCDGCADATAERA